MRVDDFKCKLGKWTNGNLANYGQMHQCLILSCIISCSCENIGDVIEVQLTMIPTTYQPL